MFQSANAMAITGHTCDPAIAYTVRYLCTALGLGDQFLS